MTSGDANVCVVRLATSYWRDERGLHMKKSLSYLRRKSSGFNWLEEDASCIGADEVLENVTNLPAADDGIYRVIICDQHRDYETGIIDDYSYKLVPFVDEDTPEVRP